RLLAVSGALKLRLRLRPQRAISEQVRGLRKGASCEEGLVLLDVELSEQAAITGARLRGRNLPTELLEQGDRRVFFVDGPIGLGRLLGVFRFVRLETSQAREREGEPAFVASLVPLQDNELSEPAQAQF